MLLAAIKFNIQNVQSTIKRCSGGLEGFWFWGENDPNGKSLSEKWELFVLKDADKSVNLWVVVVITEG